MDEMSELFDLLSEPSDSTPEPAQAAQPMTEGQRAQIRRIFATLGVSTASEQFDLVHVLVGVRLKSVADLDSKTAATLIPRLSKRVQSRERDSTGDSWADREDDTWIDKL